MQNSIAMWKLIAIFAVYSLELSRLLKTERRYATDLFFLRNIHLDEFL